MRVVSHGEYGRDMRVVADVFTPTQRMVARLLRDDLSNDDIARRLNISAKTVKTHVAACIAALGVQSRVGVAVWIQRDEGGGATHFNRRTHYEALRIVNASTEYHLAIKTMMAEPSTDALNLLTLAQRRWTEIMDNPSRAVDPQPTDAEER